MAVSPEYRSWVHEQLRLAGPVTGRSMFGGYGLYRDGLCFALIADDCLYFKVDDENRADYEAAGMRRFSPMGDGRSMSYYEVPPDVLEDPEQMRVWADRAVDAARTKGAKRKKK